MYASRLEEEKRKEGEKKDYWVRFYTCLFHQDAEIKSIKENYE